MVLDRLMLESIPVVIVWSETDKSVQQLENRIIILLINDRKDIE